MSSGNRIRSALLCITAGLLFVAYRQDAGMSRLTQTSRKLFGVPFEPVTVTSKHPFPEGTLGVVINTPKCGTGGLTETFMKSFPGKCVGQHLHHKTTYVNCENRHVVRTHDVESGIMALDKLHVSPDQKCMIATAIRDPRTWLPSVFMQRRNKELCHAKMTKKRFFSIYRHWIIDDVEQIRYFLRIARPWLLSHYRTSLTDVMNASRQNGGYALIQSPHVGGRFANCELLFLQMEESKKWPTFMESVWPGISFAKGKARTDACPESADHYKALADDYVLQEEEIEYIIGGDPDIAEYFSVYGLWDHPIGNGNPSMFQQQQ